MTQTTLDFNHRTPPANTFKPGSQNRCLYDRLLAGPITNREIMDMKIPKYTGRISEIRAFLRPHLMDVGKETRPDDRSTVTYRITGVRA